MPELDTILPAKLNAMVGASQEAFAPGTAAVTIKNRYHRWRPRDFHADAKPYSSAPTAAQMTNTSNALDSLGQAGVIAEFERGDYYVDRTYNPCGNSSDTALPPKTVYFNDTLISAGGSPSAYQECLLQDQSGNGLAGRVQDTASDPETPAEFNLPPGEQTRVLFDLCNCARSRFIGNLSLDGQNKTIALVANTARWNSNNGLHDSVGCVWDNLRLLKARWGLFGQPRYGVARNSYQATFVGNIFQRIRCEGSIDIPMLFGGNQCDDSWIGELNMIHKAGAISYLFGAGINCGTIYSNGANDACVFLDIQDGMFEFRNFYAEKDFRVPILARKNSWVSGTFKYGAGTPSTFLERCFLLNEKEGGGGLITSHERSGDSQDIQALIKLKAVANSKRNYTVYQPYLESAALPFAMTAGTGTLSTGDTLISNSRDGFKKWNASGTSAAPILTGAPIS